ncbi:hypothetical protein AS593_07485 [Caulobacter vibrioides]|nr:hypothetical protein AS593_07485 [Caulobacter vibrioides]
MKTPALRAAAFAALLCACAVVPAAAADLYKPGTGASLAADRVARQVGDSLTVLVYESSAASNTIQRGNSKKTRVAGEIGGQRQTDTARLELDGSYTGSGQTARTGKLVAQISVTVDQVLPNGDFLISGNQLLTVNAERTTIKIKGRVRPADISSANTVLSSRIGDAMIDYDGAGFASRSAQPGPLTRIFNRLGLM